MKYAEYDEDGRLGGFYTLPEWEVENNPFYRNMNLAVIEELDEDVIPPTHYVKDGKITTRPTMPLVLDCEPGRFVLSELPVPCVVCVETTEYAVDDGRFEFETAFHGTFKLFVRAWPYLDWSGEATT